MYQWREDMRFSPVLVLISVPNKPGYKQGPLGISAYRPSAKPLVKDCQYIPTQGKRALAVALRKLKN